MLIRKSGSESVGTLLRIWQQVEPQPANGSHSNESWLSLVLPQLSRSRSRALWLFHHRQSTHWHNRTMWTFVREPLSHIVAGYAELELRHSLAQCCDQHTRNGSSATCARNESSAACAWERSAPRHLFFKSGNHALGEGAVARVRSFAQQLVSHELAGFHQNGDVNHAFPQCYWFCATEGLLRPDGWLRVGSLEHFDADLRRVLADAGVGSAAAREILARYEEAAPAQRHHAARHAVARRAQEAMRVAFAVDDATRRTLCYLLVPDYLCVNALLPAARRYALPSGCNATLARIERELSPDRSARGASTKEREVLEVLREWGVAPAASPE